MSGSDHRLRVRRAASAIARVAAVVLALPIVSTCGGKHDSPEPPNVSHLLVAYDEPRGTIDTSRPATWLAEAEAQVGQLGGGQADVLLADIAAATLLGVDQAVLPTGRGELLPARVDGVATLEVRCGFADHEIADVAVAIVDGVVLPVLWGAAHGCPFWQGLGRREAYEGGFTMYRYPGDDLLVRVDGKLSATGTSVALDFRLVGRRLETRIATPTGDVIVARDGARGDIVARAANGTFRCNPTRRTCR